MHTIRVDSGRFYSAISARDPDPNGFESSANLNCLSGEIVFVEHNENAEGAAESKTNRAAVEANPSQWEEIPKHGRASYEGIEELGKEFVAEVCRKRGIAIELV